MTRARITSKGQITIPKEIRDRLNVEPGDSLDFHIENGRIEVHPVKRRRIEEFRGVFRTDSTLPVGEERARAWEARVREMLREDGSAGA